MSQNSKLLARISTPLKGSQSTATVQAQDQALRFYKTKDMREHEEKSKLAVKMFWENLNNRPKSKHHSTSQVSNRSPISALSAGESTLQSANIPTNRRNIKVTVQPDSSKRLTILLNPIQCVDTSQSINTEPARTQKIKLTQNSKNKYTQSSVESNYMTADNRYKEPLKFYKTKDMKEHEEKSKWAVQTFWDNLNGRSKRYAQGNKNTMEPSSTNALGMSSSKPLPILSRKDARPIERVNRVAKDKVIDRSNNLSSESTSDVLTYTFSQSKGDVNENGTVVVTESYVSSNGLTAQGSMELSVHDTDQLLTKVSNKRKYIGDGETNNSKLVKITIPITQKQKEASMKINLPNRPAPQVSNTQNLVSSGTLKNNGVKSLVQLCTMTLVSNKHRLYNLGDTPYHLLEPILKFCTDEELRQLEEVNSRLIDEDMELWKRFLQQKLPDQPLPDNPQDYRKIYLSIIDEEKEKRGRIIDNLRKAMAKEKAKKEARQVKMLLVTPREPKRKPAGYRKLTPLQKIRREMIRKGYVTFPYR